MSYYCWASDLSQTSGEGKLSLMFLKHVNQYSKKKIVCYSNSGKGLFYKNKLKLIYPQRKNKNNFYNNYIKVFFGIFLMWYYFFKKKKIIYIGFLPLWNFLIFLLLPPKVILGPITGNINNPKKFFGFFNVRVFIILFSYISIFILKIKKKNFFFAHENLYLKFKKYLPNKILYNYQLLYFKKSKKNLSKKNNLLIYNRDHSSKNISYIIKNLLNEKLFTEIAIVGARIKKKNFKNLGYLEHKKLMNVLRKYRYSLVSDENFFSFFVLDAISSNMKLIFNSERYKLNKYNYFSGIEFIKLKKIRLKNSKNKSVNVEIRPNLKKKIIINLNNHLRNVLI
jgi:hypothetical protein